MKFHTVLLKIMLFTMGEDLVLPSAICRKMIEMLDESKYAHDIQKISLSNGYVLSKISDIIKDEIVQLVTRIKESPKFSIRLKETLKFAPLLLYVRYNYKYSWRKNCYFCVL